MPSRSVTFQERLGNGARNGDALSPNRRVIRVEYKEQNNNYQTNRKGKLCIHAHLVELICKSPLSA